jgi:hypothetical protein
MAWVYIPQSHPAGTILGQLSSLMPDLRNICGVTPQLQSGSEKTRDNREERGSNAERSSKD